MIIPPKLHRGDPVRVIAPSGPFDPAIFEKGLHVLSERLGLVPRMRADVTARRGYLAGEDARRADSPKLLVGFSDVTALHAVLNRGGVATVHGPVVTQLGRAPDDALRHLEALLFEAPAHPGAWGVPAPGAGLVAERTVRPGRVSGPLLGGTLTILAHLAGTPYAPQLDGAILLLEDVGEKPYRIDRCLTQLALSGALAGVAGVVIGRFTACDDGGLLAADVVRETIQALGVPAVEGLPVGHEDANFAVPLGAQATLVAPGPGEEGPPRLLFDGWTARPGA